MTTIGGPRPRYATRFRRWAYAAGGRSELKTNRPPGIEGSYVICAAAVSA
jgi:hypothetical protein